MPTERSTAELLRELDATKSRLANARRVLAAVLVGSLALVVWGFAPPQGQSAFRGKPLTHWVDQLRNERDSEARRLAAFAIGMFGEEAAPYASDLIKALEEEEPPTFPPQGTVAQAAALGLGEIRPVTDNVVTALMMSFNGGKNDKVYSVLQRLGPAAKTVVPDLIRSLDSTSTQVRRRAASLLGEMGRDAKDAVDLLEKLSQSDSDGNVRQQATRALANIRGKANEAGTGVEKGGR